MVRSLMVVTMLSTSAECRFQGGAGQTSANSRSDAKANARWEQFYHHEIYGVNAIISFKWITVVTSVYECLLNA